MGAWVLINENWYKPKLNHFQQRAAVKRRDVDKETLRSIARHYNVSPQTISRLKAEAQI